MDMTSPYPPVPNVPPALEPHEKMRLRTAARHARVAYPGPVGELLEREVMVWEEFGYRFDRTGLTQRLVDHLLKVQSGEEQPVKGEGRAA